MLNLFKENPKAILFSLDDIIARLELEEGPVTHPRNQPKRIRGNYVDNYKFLRSNATRQWENEKAKKHINDVASMMEEVGDNYHYTFNSERAVARTLVKEYYNTPNCNMIVLYHNSDKDNYIKSKYSLEMTQRRIGNAIADLVGVHCSDRKSINAYDAQKIDHIRCNNMTYAVIFTDIDAISEFNNGILQKYLATRESLECSELDVLHEYLYNHCIGFLPIIDADGKENTEYAIHMGYNSNSKYPTRSLASALTGKVIDYKWSVEKFINKLEDATGYKLPEYDHLKGVKFPTFKSIKAICNSPYGEIRIAMAGTSTERIALIQEYINAVKEGNTK